MEPKTGFEPATHGLQNRCSTTELLRRFSHYTRTESSKAKYFSSLKGLTYVRGTSCDKTEVISKRHCPIQLLLRSLLYWTFFDARELTKVYHYELQCKHKYMFNSVC